ncbi:hypothetical protein CPB83DRAFT_936177, partial [Crepidotus variabilis]
MTQKISPSISIHRLMVPAGGESGRQTESVQVNGWNSTMATPEKEATLNSIDGELYENGSEPPRTPSARTSDISNDRIVITISPGSEGANSSPQASEPSSSMELDFIPIVSSNESSFSPDEEEESAEENFWMGESKRLDQMAGNGVIDRADIDEGHILRNQIIHFTGGIPFESTADIRDGLNGKLSRKRQVYFSKTFGKEFEEFKKRRANALGWSPEKPTLPKDISRVEGDQEPPNDEEPDSNGNN